MAEERTVNDDAVYTNSIHDRVWKMNGSPDLPGLKCNRCHKVISRPLMPSVSTALLRRVADIEIDHCLSTGCKGSVYPEAGYIELPEKY